MEIEKVVQTLTDAATKELSVQRKQTRTSYEELKKENARLTKELEWAKRERDAAMHDLRQWYCFSCANKWSSSCPSCVRNRINILKNFENVERRVDGYQWQGLSEGD